MAYSHRGGRGGGGGGRGGDRGGSGGYRGGRGGGSYGGRGGFAPRAAPLASEAHAFFGEGSSIPQPDAAVTALENKLVVTHQSQGLSKEMGKLKLSDAQACTHFPLRPAFGSQGTDVVLWTNYFRVNIKPKYVYAYNLEVHKTRPAKGAPRQKDERQRSEKAGVSGRKLAAIIQLALDKLREEDRQAVLATEFKSKLVSLNKLQYDDDCLEVLFLGENSKRIENWFVRIIDPVEVPLEATRQYLQTMSDPTDPEGQVFPKFSVPVDALGVILGYTPRGRPDVTAVGGARFFPIGQACVRRQLGPQSRLTAVRGYFQSVRLGTGRALLNVNVTHGVFRTAVSVAELCRWARLDCFGTDNTPSLGTNYRLKALSNFLHKARVRCVLKDGDGCEYEATKTMCGLAGSGPRQIDQSLLRNGTIAFKRNCQWGGPKEVGFKMEPRNGETTVMGNKAPGIYSVGEYTTWKYGKVPDVKLPLVNVGRPEKPIYIPAERCTIVAGQAVRSPLSGEETTAMLDFACRSPFLNAVSITADSRGALGLDRNPVLEKFGLSIDKQLLTVWGRELQCPSVLYSNGKTIKTMGGGWNMRGVSVVAAGPKIRNWFWMQIVENDRATDATEAVGEFVEFLAKTGIDIETKARPGFKVRPGHRLHIKPTQDREKDEAHYRDEVGKAFSLIDTSQSTSRPFILVVLPRHDTTLYSVVKMLGDCRFGFHTICVVERNFIKKNPMTFANVGLKWNLKNGGINHRVKDPLKMVADGKTMVVGYDVTHPTNSGFKPGDRDCPPSIAGLVASVDRDLGQWPAVAWEQRAGQEMLDDQLTKNFGSRLDLWRKNNNKALPEFIVIYRDGVSEGQFVQVLEVELPMIRAACRSRYASGRMPKLSIIVSVKRHQTRFYPTAKEDMDERSRNVRNGTVVDRGVTQARYWDFFLTAHTALKGTARPARYTVLLDEIFTGAPGGSQQQQAADELEKFTHDLCYLFGRATKAVSICPPAYYADIVCERARVHRPEYFDVSDGASTSAGGGSSGGGEAKEVHERLRDTMYYI